MNIRMLLFLFSAGSCYGGDVSGSDSENSICPGRFKPKYGHLLTSDAATQEAMQSAPYSDDRVWREREDEYRAKVEEALVASRVDLSGLSHLLCYIDSRWRILSAADEYDSDCIPADFKPREFLVNSSTGIYYEFDPMFFDDSVSKHDTDTFYEALKAGVADIRSRMAPSPPPPLRAFGGLAARAKPCGHAFCSGCLDFVTTCPTCRWDLDVDRLSSCPGGIKLGDKCGICQENLQVGVRIGDALVPASPIVLPPELKE